MALATVAMRRAVDRRQRELGDDIDWLVPMAAWQPMCDCGTVPHWHGPGYRPVTITGGTIA